MLWITIFCDKLSDELCDKFCDKVGDTVGDKVGDKLGDQLSESPNRVMNFVIYFVIYFVTKRMDKFIVKSIITFNKLQKIETVSEMESPQVTPHPEGRSQCSGRASVSIHKPRQRNISYHKICPGSCAKECHFSATGSHTRQTTPRFQGGLLLDGQIWSLWIWQKDGIDCTIYLLAKDDIISGDETLHYWLRWSIGFWNVRKVVKSRQLFLIQ